eukprot:TRINITY_DN2985_c0_g1_i1.p1 TRINITY_DN2985_c0_g1~~TRINITY_DN2985_c0_g1_i1.p1  ORF type:complete len:217 (+),score=67.32 TRINITY_DN2985_c0_g1_i1:101-751(+)
MKKLQLFVLFAIIATCVRAHDHDDDDDDSDVEWVTCGSVIKLVHEASGFRLHSHKVSYGSGSGQQSVTGVSSAADNNSLWVVKGPHGSYCPQGKLVKNGDIIRLQHLNTRRNLHSHLHRSPHTKQNEVSCYEEGDVGDTGDHWKVALRDGGDGWRREASVRFHHIDTGGYLQANPNAKYNNPIPGQIEITGVTSASKDNVWRTGEGIYFPVLNEKD